MARCGSGTWPRGSRPACSGGTGVLPSTWPSAPTEDSSPAWDSTGRCGSGTWRRRAAVKVLPGDAEGYRIAYGADGRLIAACSLGGNVRLWDARTYQELAALPHGNRVLGLAFSREGTRLATACGDNTIRLWDVATGKEVCELRGHEAYVHAVAFSPDGTRLASASGDSTVRIWDTVPQSMRAQRADHCRLPRGGGSHAIRREGSTLRSLLDPIELADSP